MLNGGNVIAAEMEEVVDLVPARGILIGMLLSLPFWGVAIWITTWMWG
jgi:hypothetical protein